MSTSQIQKGTALIIGIGSNTYTGHVVEDTTAKLDADQEVIKGEDNETLTKILSDPKKTLKVSLIAKSGSTIETVKKGDALTINSVAYMVESCEVKRSRSAMKVTLDLIKEDSMSYT
jgi:glucose-6-phosphate isomerase